MNSTVHEAAAVSSAFGVIAILVGGLVIVGALILAVQLGSGARRREPRRPLPGEQPRPPASGPVGETRERREPREVAPGERLTPHGLRPTGGVRGDDQRRPRWNGG
ncbi:MULTISPECIES: DUF6479 family protein [Streptomyces]|uniref:DUF6479 family protein n=1 Tax=Streptomyces TaxID=1883 RepID=UPI0006C13DDD|nr:MULTISPECIES: DUF6479 family protein [Streptomyces]KOV72175.1 hypothetical protein ADL00_06490 [Streptomyces sp. AS58]